MSIYIENGYENRKDYLIALSYETGIDRQTVFMLADILGSSEDFDGLVSTLEDHANPRRGLNMNLIFHTDPAHGWLELPLSLMHEIDIHPSVYSYFDKDNAYLEEDCDAALALNALKALGINVNISD
jgi:hypothetical protein